MRKPFSYYPILFLILLFSCREAPEESRKNEIFVKYEIVDKKTVVNKVRAPGRLSSKVESRLSFKTGGVIERIVVTDGTRVKKGHFLASLDLDEIQSQVRQAELALDKAERDFKRAENLYRDSVVTLELYQNATTALEMARSNLRIARFNLEHSKISAPSDGIVLKKLAEENEIVGPGHPVFLFASTSGDWIFRLHITDRDIVKLTLNDSAHIEFDAFPGEKFDGYISQIGELADPYTGTFEIELGLKEKPETLISGLIGSAQIFPSGSRFFPIIPHEAILVAEGKNGLVYVVENGQPVKRSVIIESILDEGMTVSSGIEPGDSLIIEGGNFIRENVPVVLQHNTIDHRN